MNRKHGTINQISAWVPSLVPLWISPSKPLTSWGLKALMAGVLLLSNQSVALQVKEMIQDERLTLKVALYDLNRIEVRGDRIASVFGNSGTFTLDHDTDRGHLYIKPTQSNGKRPLSLSITTENGLVQDLILTPFDMPSETIILKTGRESFESHQPGPIDLIKSMAQGIAPQGFEGAFEVREEGRDLYFWKNIRTRQIKSYRNAYLIGEVISFKNETGKPLTLHETQFVNEKTLAVGLEKHRVEDDETILVYRVLANRENSSRKDSASRGPLSSGLRDSVNVDLSNNDTADEILKEGLSDAELSDEALSGDFLSKELLLKDSGLKDVSLKGDTSRGFASRGFTLEDPEQQDTKSGVLEEGVPNRGFSRDEGGKLFKSEEQPLGREGFAEDSKRDLAKDVHGGGAERKKTSQEDSKKLEELNFVRLTLEPIKSKDDKNSNVKGSKESLEIAQPSNNTKDFEVTEKITPQGTPERGGEGVPGEEPTYESKTGDTMELNEASHA